MAWLATPGTGLRMRARAFRSSWYGSTCVPLLALFLASMILLSQPVDAASLPSGFTEVRLATGLYNPTTMAIAPDGRVFISLQTGQLRVVKNNTLLPTPFVTLDVDTQVERGLLGIAFDPNFAVNQYVYVYYTAKTPYIHNRLSRFTANGDVAAAGSERPILDLDKVGPASHNGGALRFGADGKLYIVVGDNAYPKTNAQNLNIPFGKILRINPDGSIPNDNPLYNQATGNNRAIWALGLRNPFTFDIQPGTGRIFINDVGADLYEEINEVNRGANYGWPDTEGPTTNTSFTAPFYTYAHGANNVNGCAIVGAAFYNPQVNQFPAEYTGDYFFADYCKGWMKRIDTTTKAVTTFATGIVNPVDIRVGMDGSLYYLSRGKTETGNGALYRVQYNSRPQAPQISAQPGNVRVGVGQSATFGVTASGTGSFTYQWQRNGINIDGATSPEYTIPSTVLADNGAVFRCIVSNAVGSTTSNTAVLTVINDRPPQASITAPAQGSLYSAGDTITYNGAATDPEDGELPASAYTWQIDFHHDAHVHPFIPATRGLRNGSFKIPTTGETSANVWYRVYLTVTDKDNLTYTTYRDILPRTSMLTFVTNPPGLQIALDEQPVTPTEPIKSVVGMQRTLGAVTPQQFAGANYYFCYWSDGGAATHSIFTPANNATYLIVYRPPNSRFLPVAASLGR